MIFRKISEIDVDNKSTWEDAVFLTFDIDWACDDILSYTIDLVERAKVSATWFVTHETPLLDRLRGNKNFELGIHPNFNNLLSGDTSNGRTAEEVIDKLLFFVPEAKAVRSHCTTQSSRLLSLFYNKGLTHDSNNFIPTYSGMKLSPWLLWNGLLEVPFFWADDVACAYDEGWDVLSIIQNNKGLKVFDFYPMHVFLNTGNMEQFDRLRRYEKEPMQLKKYKNIEINGSENALKTILKEAAK